MTILFGIGAAVSYGLADFFGGLVTRRMSVFAVVLWSQIAGAALLAIAFPLFDAPFDRAAVLWGAGGGIVGGIGVLFLYRGLAVGRMSIVAPVTAVEAASIPVLFGYAIGERPSALALTGVLVALGAVYLVSSAPDEPSLEPGTETGPGTKTRPIGIVHALAAGAGFGAFFILLERAGDDTGLWPLVGGRAASITTALIAGLILRGSLRPPQRETAPGVVAAGTLDVVANIFYLLSVRRGLLSLAAVLTSMYPATTVVCARFFLHELVHRRQLVGLVLVAVAIVLIGYG